ncbi:cell division protein FtsX [Duganella sp. Leaf61]|uniref:FtsX-like permease family protein n=1 Tax=Duganella sp. Leaf61 TaxID=1736227 RepID=UPI0006F35640|nr:FtsX-like permease family protein [Duganella sp. Leaf61]KQN78055.1 cell division protein FtsX [Duganella sp. Leaf61]
MKLQDFRIGWRTLLHEPGYSLVVILGLAVGLCTCILLLGYVRYSLQYDAHVPNADQMVVVTQRYNVDPQSPLHDVAPAFLRQTALATPGVVDATVFFPSRPETTPLVVRIGEHRHHLQGLLVLPGFADMLGLQAVQGDLHQALAQPDAVVLTQATAQRLFGTTDAVGRTMQAEGKTVRVGAVVRTPPPTTTIPFDSLLGANSTLTDPMVRDELLTGQQGWMGKVLLRVTSEAALPAIVAALQQAVDRAPSLRNVPPETLARLGTRKIMDIGVTPLRHAYFDHQVQGNRVFKPGSRANPAVVAALAAIALLVLALAAINYVNLATIRVLRRQREVAVRKVLGASARRLVLHFVVESVAVSVMATVLGLVLAWLALPQFSLLMNRDLDGLLSLPHIAAALALGALLGVATALYPAWIALRVLPTQVLAERGDSESMAGMRWRRALTIGQVAIAMGFVSVTAAVAWQTAFALRASPGFDPAPFVIVDLPAPVRDSAPARAFMTALAAQPGVQGIVISEDPVGRLDQAWTRELRREGGPGAGMEMKGVSANFFELYRIAPEAGRLFQTALDKEDDPVPVVLNAIATRDLGFASPQAAVGQVVLFTGFDGKVVRKRVVGIAPDLHFHTLREAPRATAYELWTAGVALSVRASAPAAQVEALVRDLWPRYFPDAIMHTERAGAILAANYADESRLSTLLVIATAIALAIAAFGTYVLSATTVQRRAREIVLRKLHGARSGDIALLVVRDTGVLVLVAAIVGLPLAALAIQRYLAGYVAHAPGGYWTLLLSLAMTVMVALLAIARQARVAMRMAPADALRA